MISFFKEVKNKIKNFKGIDDVLSKNYLKFYFQMQKTFIIKRENKMCFYTGRKRGVYTFFNLSRQTIKNFASKELLPGVIKGSW